MAIWQHSNKYKLFSKCKYIKIQTNKYKHDSVAGSKVRWIPCNMATNTNRIYQFKHRLQLYIYIQIKKKTLLQILIFSTNKRVSLSTYFISKLQNTRYFKIKDLMFSENYKRLRKRLFHDWPDRRGWLYLSSNLISISELSENLRPCSVPQTLPFSTYEVEGVQILQSRSILETQKQDMWSEKALTWIDRLKKEGLWKDLGKGTIEGKSAGACEGMWS